MNIPSKPIEFLKVGGFALLVILTGIFASIYSETLAALVLAVGLIAAVRMAVLVFKGGKAFD